MHCAGTVPRAAALGWHVFGTARAYGAFMAASGLVYAFCIFSTMVRRRIKDISKPTLAKVCAGVRHGCRDPWKWLLHTRVLQGLPFVKVCSYEDANDDV